MSICVVTSAPEAISCRAACRVCSAFAAAVRSLGADSQKRRDERSLCRASSRDAAGNDIQDLQAHIPGKAVAAVGQLFGIGAAQADRPRPCVIQQAGVDASEVGVVDQVTVLEFA